MDEDVKESIKRQTESGLFLIPNNYEIIDEIEDIPMESDDMIYHWNNNEFYKREWWEKNEPQSAAVTTKMICQNITVIRSIPKPRVYEPVVPEKLRVIRNIKRLIKKTI